MVLGRRHRPGLGKRVREVVWPRAGAKRAAKYISHRVRRLPGTPYSIAAGFACGAAVSFTPFIGFHFLLGALLAFVIGGNLIASAIGTAVGNPWTFPLIWSLIYALGRLVLGQSGGEALPADLSLSYIFENPGNVLYPMVIGSLPLAPAVWLIFFWPCYKAVARYQEARRQARAKGGRRRRLRAAARHAAHRPEGESS